MSDELIERLRLAADRAAYEPHLHHAAADELARLSAEVERRCIERDQATAKAGAMREVAASERAKADFLRAALADERAHADALAEALERAIEAMIKASERNRLIRGFTDSVTRQVLRDAIKDARRARRQG